MKIGLGRHYTLISTLKGNPGDTSTDMDKATMGEKELHLDHNEARKCAWR